MGDPTENCPAGLSDPGHVVGPHGPFFFSAQEQVSLPGRREASTDELPSQLKNMEMEGQCQSSYVARKMARLKGRRASVHWQQREGWEGYGPCAQSGRKCSDKGHG